MSFMTETVTMSVKGENLDFDLSAIPESMYERLAAYGAYVKIQRAASGESKGADDCRRVFKDLSEGIWREGGGGKSADPVARELATIVSDRLVSAGWKRAEADKMARKPTDALVALLGKAMPDKSEASIKSAADKMAKTLRATAEENVANREASLADLADLFEDDDE